MKQQFSPPTPTLRPAKKYDFNQAQNNRSINQIKTNNKSKGTNTVKPRTINETINQTIKTNKNINQINHSKGTTTVEPRTISQTNNRQQDSLSDHMSGCFCNFSSSLFRMFIFSASSCFSSLLFCLINKTYPAHLFDQILSIG